MGVALRYWRDERGLKIDELVEKTGVSRATISRMINDQKYEPHPYNVKKVAEGLGISIQQLRNPMHQAEKPEQQDRQEEGDKTLQKAS